MSKEDYNPSEFNIPPGDDNGRPVKMRTRIQSVQSQAVAAILASRRFPYTSKAALIRHALERHLEWLGTLEDVPVMVAQFQMRTDLGEFEREARTFEVRFQSLEMKVHHEFAMGRRGQARKFLERMKGYLLTIQSPARPTSLRARRSELRAQHSGLSELLSLGASTPQ